MPVWGKSWIIFLGEGWVQSRSRGEMSDLGLFDVAELHFVLVEHA